MIKIFFKGGKFIKKLKKVQIVFFILCIILVFFLILKSTYSKYKTSLETKAITCIAKPLLNITFEEAKIIENLNLDKYSYEFSVKNFVENNTTQTEFIYNIAFNLSQENAPIMLELYRKTDTNEEKLKLINNKTELPEVLELNKKENKYRLEIYYDKNSSILMNNNLDLMLDIQAVQKEV